ncbi:ABC transporter ATP-binding protein [Pseudokineococcus sp. 1T1Z-3]|uniref:ABC transporter ATP-binding protein n=1 Tax=Pseudokineococcus sp. 1T1Z-3 TaxID=3132745 RepID=UPI0030967536
MSQGSTGTVRAGTASGVPTAKGTPEVPVLDLDGVTVVRGGQTLLDDVSWAVGADERWVVLGPNGAGKTTLLQVAAGRVHPTRGRAEVLEEELGLTDVFELRPRIGLASAALAERVPAHERVVDVVLTASYGMVGRWREAYEGPDHDRAQALLRQLGVDGLGPRAYGTLSEGERKRVQIARALMADPELVLLDEPAAGLDLGGREDLVRRLGALAADPLAPALVLVTHHVEEVPPGVTHALLLRAGRVVGQGPVEEVLTAPALGETFGLALRVERTGNRWSARAAAA